MLKKLVGKYQFYSVQHLAHRMHFKKKIMNQLSTHADMFPCMTCITEKSRHCSLMLYLAVMCVCYFTVTVSPPLVLLSNYL